MGRLPEQSSLVCQRSGRKVELNIRFLSSLKNIVSVAVEAAHCPQCACAAQRTTLWTFFSPPPFCGSWGLNSGLQACLASTFTYWTILPVLDPLFIFTDFENRNGAARLRLKIWITGKEDKNKLDFWEVNSEDQRKRTLENKFGLPSGFHHQELLTNF